MSTAAATIQCHTLPLPRVLEDIERRRGNRRGPDASVIRVYYLLQLYSSPRGIGELSSAEICRRLNISRKTAALALRRLVGMGLLRTWHRAAGKVVMVRFVFREIYRLFKRGWSMLKHGVLFFSSSYPQVVFPPPHIYMPPQRVKSKRQNHAEDALTRDRPAARPCVGAPATPGVAMEVLRGVVSQMGFPDAWAPESFTEDDMNATADALLATFGRLVLKHGHFGHVQAHPAAFQSLLQQIKTGNYEIEHPGPGCTEVATWLYFWARCLVNWIFDLTPAKTRDQVRTERRNELLAAKRCA